MPTPFDAMSMRLQISPKSRGMRVRRSCARAAASSSDDAAEVRHWDHFPRSVVLLTKGRCGLVRVFKTKIWDPVTCHWVVQPGKYTEHALKAYRGVEIILGEDQEVDDAAVDDHGRFLCGEERAFEVGTDD